MNTPRVPIIVLASTKGGVGKTTVAFCLATALARRLHRARPGMPEHRVVCIDAAGLSHQSSVATVCLRSVT